MKTKYIVQNALASQIHQDIELVQKLQTSVIIDKTTNVSTAKELAVVMRVYDSL